MSYPTFMFKADSTYVGNILWGGPMAAVLGRRMTEGTWIHWAPSV